MAHRSNTSPQIFRKYVQNTQQIENRTRFHKRGLEQQRNNDVLDIIKNTNDMLCLYLSLLNVCWVFKVVFTEITGCSLRNVSL